MAASSRPSEAADFECAVIGGGVAGLSAALVLGRARRRTVLFDVGDQSNSAASHVGGGLAFDGTPPAELYARGRAQLDPYESVTIRDLEVMAVSPRDGGFALQVREEAEPVWSRTLILATGMEYEIPDVPGFAEHWGGSVFHCPFCHGWEVRDRRLVVYAHDEMADRLARLARGWSDDVDVVSPEQVVELQTESGAVRGVVLRDGSQIACDAVLVHAPLRLRGHLVEDLGLELTDEGFVAIDSLGHTSMPGIYAAGDLAVAPQQVPVAAGSGHLAGLVVVRELLLGLAG